MSLFRESFNCWFLHFPGGLLVHSLVAFQVTLVTGCIRARPTDEFFDAAVNGHVAFEQRFATEDPHALPARVPVVVLVSDVPPQSALAPERLPTALELFVQAVHGLTVAREIRSPLARVRAIAANELFGALGEDGASLMHFDSAHILWVVFIVVQGADRQAARIKVIW